MIVIENSTFWTTMITACLITLAMGVVLTLLAQDVYRRGRKRIIFYDPDAVDADIKYVKTGTNEFTIGKGESAKRYILEAAGRIGRATWIVHPRHGWNFVGKSDAETVQSDSLLYKLAISNPKAYHLAIASNRARDALNANAKDDKWGWVGPAAAFAVVALIVIMGTLAFVAIKVTSKAQEAGAG